MNLICNLNDKKRLRREMIGKAEKYLKDSFAASEYMQQHPEEMHYRLEHSYRVANIGKEIAEAQGFDPTAMAIGCLLHDIGYVYEMKTWEERKEHGRVGAKLARPFLETLGEHFPVKDICYGIAIHVDDKSDFEWPRSAFAETIGDADNIDRFDVYRIHETLHHQGFLEMSLTEQKERVASTLGQLRKLYDMKTATETAQKMWQERVGFYIQFYEKLQKQLERSDEIF